MWFSRNKSSQSYEAAPPPDTSELAFTYPGVISRWFTWQQTVTHPSSNRAWCRTTSFIDSNLLTTTPRRHPILLCVPWLIHL